MLTLEQWNALLGLATAVAALAFMLGGRKKLVEEVGLLRMEQRKEMEDARSEFREALTMYQAQHDKEFARYQADTMREFLATVKHEADMRHDSTNTTNAWLSRLEMASMKCADKQLQLIDRIARLEPRHGA